MDASAKRSSSSCFPTTQWTQIIGVIQCEDSQAAWNALEEFCQRYRSAIYNFFRRHGCDVERAQDYTQEFFARRILERWDNRDGFLHSAQKKHNGQFRGFLSHVLWRFLQDKWKEIKTQRAGGGKPHIPLDDIEALSGEFGMSTFEKFGHEFDRVFALEVIQKAAERSKHSKYLAAHLRGEVSQKEAATALGISEKAFTLSFFRFRERLARDLWDEVSKLVGPDKSEVRAEIAYLMSLFADSGT